MDRFRPLLIDIGMTACLAARFGAGEVAIIEETIMSQYRLPGIKVILLGCVHESWQAAVTPYTE